MSTFFHNRKYFLQFFFWIFTLIFLSNKCLADLNDLIKYEDKHENERITSLALNEPDDETKESTDISKELTLPKDLKYPLFLGLCCGKCGGNWRLRCSNDRHNVEYCHTSIFGCKSSAYGTIGTVHPCPGRGYDMFLWNSD